jgi:hypothetical protein
MGLNTVRSVRAKVAEIIRVSGGAPRINKTGYSAAAHPNSAHVKNPCKGGVHIVLWITLVMKNLLLSQRLIVILKLRVHKGYVTDVAAILA